MLDGYVHAWWMSACLSSGKFLNALGFLCVNIPLPESNDELKLCSRCIMGSSYAVKKYDISITNYISKPRLVIHRCRDEFPDDT